MKCDFMKFVLPAFPEKSANLGYFKKARWKFHASVRKITRFLHLRFFLWLPTILTSVYCVLLKAQPNLNNQDI